MATKPVRSREKALRWVRDHGGSLVGQAKPGPGKPTRNWQILSPDLGDIPDGEGWLLRAKDKATLRVFFISTSSGARRAEAQPTAGSAAPAAPSAASSEMSELLTVVRSVANALSAIGQGMTNAQTAVNQARESERQSLVKAKEVVDSDNALNSSAVQWTGIAFIGERICSTIELIATRKILKDEDLPDYHSFKKWQAKHRARKAIASALVASGADEPDGGQDSTGTAA